MDDPISRQMAIDMVDRLYRGTKNDESYMITGYNHALSDTQAILKSLPSAQKTGTWIHERLASTIGGTYPIVRCSACMGDMPFEWPTKYCPHCGARMESE